MGPYTIGEVPSLPQAWNVFRDDGTPWDLTGYSTITPVLTFPDGTSQSVNPFGAGSTLIPPNPPNTANNYITLHFGAPSPFTQEGQHRLQFEFGKSDGTLDFSKVLAFDVVSAAANDESTSWTTPNQVLQITGQEVTSQAVDVAQGIIELVSSRSFSDSIRIRARDLAWLGKAVAYQAAWQGSQPDIFTKSAYDSVSQDGFSGKLFNKSGNYLGPLAERALKNCSWLRSRSLRMSNPFVDGDIDISIDPLGDDSILNWERI